MMKAMKKWSIKQTFHVFSKNPTKKQQKILLAASDTNHSVYDPKIQKWKLMQMKWPTQLKKLINGFSSGHDVNEKKTLTWQCML